MSTEERAEALLPQEGVVLPTNWATMSTEEQKAWIEQQLAAAVAAALGTLPATWASMTTEERAEALAQEGVALPTNWATMSTEEQEAWIEQQAVAVAVAAG